MRVTYLVVADHGRVVVAGAGLAGLRTVTELRTRGGPGPNTPGGGRGAPALRPPAAVQEGADRPDAGPVPAGRFRRAGRGLPPGRDRHEPQGHGPGDRA